MRYQQQSISVLAAALTAHFLEAMQRQGELSEDIREVVLDSIQFNDIAEYLRENPDCPSANMLIQVPGGRQFIAAFAYDGQADIARRNTPEAEALCVWVPEEFSLPEDFPGDNPCFTTLLPLHIPSDSIQQAENSDGEVPVLDEVYA